MFVTMAASNDGIPEGLYPMRAVTRFTGLSPDVVRVWERRYDAVTPDRTAGRARRYSSTDIRRLLMLNELTRRGHSIGDVARLADDRLRDMLDRDSILREPMAPQFRPDPEANRDGIVAEYLGAMGRFEVRRAQEVLGAAAALLPPTTFLFDVIMPILREVGLRWSRDEMGIAHEHVVSSHVKGFLTGLLRLVPPPAPGAPRLLAATPRNHHHEFGALMAAYLGAVRGWDVVYVGPDIPGDDLRMAADLAGADLIVLSVLRVPTPKDLKELATELRALARRVTLWIGTPPEHPIRQHVKNIRFFDRLEDLLAALDERRQVLALHEASPPTHAQEASTTI